MTRAALLVLATLGCGCAAQSTAPSTGLFDTYWRATQIDRQAIVHRPGTREPHIVLKREGSRVSGFAGCNGFAGSFRQDGEKLRFDDRLAMTRMACVGEGDTLEAAFTKALLGTVSYRMAGQELELRDALGAVRMTLEARGPVK